MSARRPPTPADVAAARALLAVGPDAGRGEILAAWKAQMRRHHPDAVGPEARGDAEARTKQLNAAKSLLVTALEIGVARPAVAPGPSSVQVQAAPAATVATSTVHRPIGEAVTPIENRWLWLLGLSVLAFVAVFVIASVTLPTGRSRIDEDAIAVPVSPPPTIAPPRPVPAVGVPEPTEPRASSTPLLAEPGDAAAVMLETTVTSDFLAQERVIDDSDAVYPQIQAWSRQVRNADLGRADVALALSALTCAQQEGTERARCSFPVPSLVNLAALELVYRYDAGWQVVGTVT